MGLERGGNRVDVQTFVTNFCRTSAERCITGVHNQTSHRQVHQAHTHIDNIQPHTG
jgi:hypothetical protein